MFKQLASKCAAKQSVFRTVQQCNCIQAFSQTVLCKPSLPSFNSSIINFPLRYVNIRHYNLSSSNREKDANRTEVEYLLQLKNDPDIFGEVRSNEEPDDEGDIQEQQYLEHKPAAHQKLSTKQYADLIKSLISKHKIKEAIDFVEVRMIKTDRVQPENYIFNLLIGACGRVGYTKKAFSLYNEIKRRNLVVTPGTYTALFNACSNSPWPTTDGLSRAKHLRSIMIEKMYEPNLMNYNAMIKAFGRCGDLVTAFALVDEMCAKRHSLKSDTLNFLLQACIADKEAGFRHALLVWRKFIKKSVTPSLFTYNLMLRCIRDCSLGDIETTKDVINNLLPKNEKILLQDLKTQDVKIPENSLVINTPNLMATVPHLGNILSLSEVTKPEDRLLLVGGYKEFLKNMDDNNCKPDIKTFTQLLDSIPSTLAAEDYLLKDLKNNKIEVDIDFYNMLIKKRSMRFDYENARQVLGMIQLSHMRPNLITYGVLALGCKTKEEAASLLEEMAESNYRLNSEILGAMLNQACHHLNFRYVMYIIELCTTEQIKPRQKFLETLEIFRKKCKHISNDNENTLSHSPKFQNNYKIFKARYKTWREEIQIDDEENAHPWQQYRELSNTNTKNYKDKQANTRFKPVHTSLFRQKKTAQNIRK